MRRDSFAYSKNDIPHMCSGYNHPPSEQNMISKAGSGFKSKSEGPASLSPRESSYASNQFQAAGSSYDPSCDSTAIVLSENRENIPHPQGSQPSFATSPKHADMVVQGSICNPISIQKQVHSGNELENQRDVDRISTGIPTNLNSSMSSGLDEISLEAISFCQLQLLMEKLDIRKKLTIRDSLYRLAKNAEQRHNSANPGGWSTDDGDSNQALMAEETNKCKGYMDLETNTNPVDRSVAHLLFHRPADSTVTPAHDALSCKSHTTIHGSITSPSVMMVEEVVCQEETTAETDKLADH